MKFDDKRAAMMGAFIEIALLLGFAIGADVCPQLV